MITWTIAAGVGAIGAWLYQRRTKRSPEPTSARAQPVVARNPTRVLDPQKQAARLSPVWQLHSNGCQCAQARAHAGKRLPIEAVQPLLMGGQPCRCYYRPLADQRRSLRRAGEDRRAALRFELRKNDRRAGDRRQGGAVWERTLGY